MQQLERLESVRLTDKNLELIVTRSLPEAVCQLPTVAYGRESVTVNQSVILANMVAIREAWILARQMGKSVLTYDLILNQLRIDHHAESPIGSTFASRNSSQRPSVTFDGTDNSKEFTLTHNSLLAAGSCLRHIYFYGIPDYAYKVSRPIISCQLEKAIKDYYSTVDQIAQKISKSYGRALTLGGLDMANAPLVKAVQEKILKDIQGNSEVILPEGSEWNSAGITLSDLDKAILPVMEAVAVESGLPFWLLFKLKVETVSQLEERAIFLQTEFNKSVLSPLLELLEHQGYTDLTVYSPSYRDRFFDATVAGLEQEVLQKKATTARNNALARQVELGNLDRLAKSIVGVVEPSVTGATPGQKQSGALEAQVDRGLSGSDGLSVAKD
jgi:hypothetical protein